MASISTWVFGLMLLVLFVLAKDVNGYIEGISQLLESGSNKTEFERRRKFALSHTWEASVNGLYAAMNALNK